MTVFKWAYIIIGFILLVAGFKTKESGWNLLAIIFFCRRIIFKHYVRIARREKRANGI